jgi:Fic family protein
LGSPFDEWAGLTQDRCAEVSRVAARVSKARSGSIEEKVELLRELEARCRPQQLAEYRFKFEVSWIYHDSALEGVVYEPRELLTALGNNVASDSSLIPVYDEIRQHQAAIALVRELAAQKKLVVDLELLKQIYVTLAPEDADKGPPRYRKEMPLHRLYFHDISDPDKIAPAMKQLVDWLAGDELARLMHPTRIAAKAHQKLLEIYPFPKHSGKVARLLMNLILLHAGFPPAIIHSTERQRYYDALRASPDAVASIVNESLLNGIESATRYFMKLHGIKDEAG